MYLNSEIVHLKHITDISRCWSQTARCLEADCPDLTTLIFCQAQSGCYVDRKGFVVFVIYCSQCPNRFTVSGTAQQYSRNAGQ